MAGPVDRQPKGTAGAGDVATSMRKAQPYIDAAWQFVGAVGLLTWAGYWADKRFGTKPWLLVVGATLGFLVGMYSFIRLVLRFSERDRQESAQAGKPDDPSQDQVDPKD